jgi:hypothetical protein
VVAQGLEALEQFSRDAPPEHRDAAKHRIIEQTEAYCNQARIREVGFDQLVIGVIRATPSHLRMGLRNSLRARGVIVEKFDQHFMMP